MSCTTVTFTLFIMLPSLFLHEFFLQLFDLLLCHSAIHQISGSGLTQIHVLKRSSFFHPGHLVKHLQKVLVQDGIVFFRLGCFRNADAVISIVDGGALLYNFPSPILPTVTSSPVSISVSSDGREHADKLKAITHIIVIEKNMYLNLFMLRLFCLLYVDPFI